MLSLLLVQIVSLISATCHHSSTSGPQWHVISNAEENKMIYFPRPLPKAAGRIENVENTGKKRREMLSLLIILPLIGVLFILLMEKKNYTKEGGSVNKLCLKIALLISGLDFIIAILLWLLMDDNIQFQYIEDWGTLYNDSLCHLILGVDGISLLLVLLTTFLTPLLILCPPKNGKSPNTYIILILLLESMLIGVFVVLDLLLFYICYESVLIPMFLIIIIWGSREWKIKAAYQLFLYTLIGSLFMLFAIIILYYQTGTTDYLFILSSLSIGDSILLPRENLLWLCYFFSFSVKIPLWPIYGWLPEAHTEAPTSGSMILAGILLKLAGYGFIRYSIPLFPNSTEYFTTLIYTITTISILLSSLSCLRQIDLKKIIAYSSIGHMGVTILGLFSNNLSAIQGSIFMMLSHGLISPALFYCIGILYNRSGTRLIKYFRGITLTMPLFSVSLFILFSSNMGVPLTIGFPGEYLCYYGTFIHNPLICLIVTSNLVLCSAYSIWLCNRILFGTISPLIPPSINITKTPIGTDLTRSELCLLLPFLTLIILFGIYPTPILNTIHYSSSLLTSI